MLREYIDKQAAIDALGEEPENWIGAEFDLGAQDQYRWDIKAIKAVPPADVRPVVRGRWEIDEIGWYCTMCGLYPPFDCDPEENGVSYCPYCGADMMQYD